MKKDTMERIIEKDGLYLRYLVQGQGEAIVLLPSLGRGPKDFDVLADYLVHLGYLVIRPFPREFYNDPIKHAAASFADYAKDIMAVLRSETQSKAIIAGHAFGNFLARMTATCFPKEIKGVVLLAGSPGKTLNGASSIPPDILESVYSSGDASLSRPDRLEHLRKAFFASGNDPAVWLNGWYPEVKKAQTVTWHATGVDAYFMAGQAPVLDIQAEQDAVVPIEYRSMISSSLGDRATVVMVQNAGHALLPEQPRQVAQLMHQWIKKLSSND